MVGGAGQWALGARTGRSGPRVSEGALRERSRGSRREVEEGKWSEGADRRAPSVSDGRRGCEVMRVTRKRREERADALEQAREEGKQAAREKGKRRRVVPVAGLPGLRWATVG